jgi:histidinol-phosphate aminotransferase
MKPLVPNEIAHIAPYEPGKPLEELERELGSAWPAEGAVKLASNENPLGPSPRALEAARRQLAEAHRYPDGAAYYLRGHLAEKLRVAPAQVLVGSGSNELIDLLVQTFVSPDEEVVSPACSFACYRLSAEAHRRRFRETPNGARLQYDLEALIAGVGEKTKIVFLANPNNPTGAYVNRADFARLVEKLPQHVLLAVDEAYFEYSRAADYPNALEWMGKRERLVVLRTFSKIHGLAGLRVGYAVAPPEVCDFVHRVRLPFNVSAIGQAAARAALDDVEHLERSRRLNAAEIVRVGERLSALGLDVLPSQANFVLVDLGAKNGRDVYRALLSQAVIVRPMSSYGLLHHLRITIGTESENERMLEALGKVL